MLLFVQGESVDQEQEPRITRQASDDDEEEPWPLIGAPVEVRRIPPSNCTAARWHYVHQRMYR
jgi:hypothetical protein